MKKPDFNFGKFGKDVVLNFIASIAIIGTLQMFVYPFLSHEFGQVVFGSILLLMGVVNTVALTTGGALDNVRLITYQDYTDRKLQGDFKVILGYASGFGIIAITAVTIIFTGRINIIDILLLIAVTFLTILRAYLSVEYRIKIKYAHICRYNFSACAGYVVGAAVSLLTGVWQLIFICGELCAVMFAVFTTEFVKAPGGKTVLFKSTLTGFIQLALSALICNVLIYLDRFIIYPFMGGDKVAVFFAASLFGKLISMVFQPVAGVFLTYLAQSKQKMRLKQFWEVNLSIVLLSGLFYILCIILAPLVTGILYPDIAAQALEILPAANLAAIVTTMGMLTQPVLLKFSSMYWQVVLQLIFGVTYFFSGVILLNIYGLMGFCIASLLSSMLRLIIMWIVGSCSLSR